MMWDKAVVYVVPGCAELNGDGQSDLDNLQALAAILLQPESPFASKYE